eukprot:16432852-Heterocapsa_arctica.AAC.1
MLGGGDQLIAQNYDIAAGDREEDDRQDEIDRINREKEQQERMKKNVSEQAKHVSVLAEEQSAMYGMPGSSTSGSGLGRGAKIIRDIPEPDEERGLKRGPKFDSAEVKEAKAKAKAASKA